jgi:hypothetical protein
MKTLLSAIALASLAVTAHAAPLPATWSAIGNAGSSATADGNISLAPGDKGFIWVSTAGGIQGEGRLNSVDNSGATDGSSVTSGLFAAKAGDTLSFYFNFLTSDGAGFADYAWAQLVAESGDETLLFTARTTPNGNTVPGFGMPAPGVTLDPATVAILQGTNFSGIGGDSGTCFDTGCGHTGWVKADFLVAAAGNYRLRAGATNWTDASFDTALAIADVTIGGISIDPTVPEPASLALVGLALVGAGVARRRRA